MTPNDNPMLDLVREMTAAARQTFREEAAPLLKTTDPKILQFADAVERAIGEISPWEALNALRHFVADQGRHVAPTKS
jgi:flagellar biosynthesis regulator FlbT